MAMTPKSYGFLLSFLTLSTLAFTGCDQSSSDTGEATTPSPSITEVHKSSSAPQMTVVSAKDLNTVKVKLNSNLKLSGVESSVKSVQATEVPGLYYVQVTGIPAFYTGADGKYVFQGNVARLGENPPVDISATLRNSNVVSVLSGIPLSQSINFKPKGKPKGLLYVFTDVDCGYCRKLHSEIGQLNDLGVEVRYLAWPRSEASVQPMKNVWCSSDPKAAMTQAKLGQPIPKAKACDDPVQQQVDLGHELGVQGTPAIFTVTGEQVGGYVPAKDLAKLAIEAGTSFK